MLIKIDPKLGKAIHFPLHFPFLAIYYYVPIQGVWKTWFTFAGTEWIPLTNTGRMTGETNNITINVFQIISILNIWDFR